MSSQQIEKLKTKAVAKPVSITGMVEQSVRELGKALPAHMNAERLCRIALTTLKLNPKLYDCDPYSFLGALFQSAQLGLEPNVEGQAYIIPYSVQGKKVAQFQIGYKGLVDLFYRHNKSVALQFEKVCDNDHFDFDLGKGEISHKPPLQNDRGDVYAYYSVAHLKNQGTVFKVMARGEVMDYAKKFSKCYDSRSGNFRAGTPWASHFDAMALKTCMKQLMKLLPKSFEIQRALAMDETVKTEVGADMFAIPNDDDFAPEAEPDGDFVPESASEDVITEKQLKRLFAIQKSAGMPDEALKALLKSGFGVETRSKILKKDYEAICDMIESERGEA